MRKRAEGRSQCGREGRRRRFITVQRLLRPSGSGICRSLPVHLYFAVLQPCFYAKLQHDVEKPDISVFQDLGAADRPGPEFRL
jgi:hypothetical protein